METRRKNKTAHPGSVDLPGPRRSSKDVADSKLQKARDKEASLQRRAAAIKKVSQLEGRIQKDDEKERALRVTKATAKNASQKSSGGNGPGTKRVPISRQGAVADLNDYDEVTQKAAPGRKKPATRKRKLAEVTEGSDDDVNDQGRGSDDEEILNIDESELTEIEETPKPKKKAKKASKASTASKSERPTRKTKSGIALRESIQAARKEFLLGTGSDPSRDVSQALNPKDDDRDISLQSHGFSNGATQSGTAPEGNDWASAEQMDVDDDSNVVNILQSWQRGASMASVESGSANLKRTGVTATGAVAAARKTSSASAIVRTKAIPSTPFTKTTSESSLVPEVMISSVPKSSRTSKPAAGPAPQTKISKSTNVDATPANSSSRNGDASNKKSSSNKAKGKARAVEAAPASEDEAVGEAPEKPKPRPKPRPKARATTTKAAEPMESDINQVIDSGIVRSDDESAERDAALSSPVKSTVARMTSKNMVAIKDIDVSTPKPARLKTKVEPLSGDEDKGPGKSKGKSGSKKLPDAGKPTKKAPQEDVKSAKGKGKGSSAKNTKNARDPKGTKENTKIALADEDSDIEMLDEPATAPSGRSSTVSSTTSSAASNHSKTSKTSNASSSNSKKPASGKKWTTTDLPTGAQDNDRWSNLFIPTLLKYQGSRHDPWSWDPNASAAVVQKIWDHVYGETLPHRVVVNDNVHKVATQRIYDWRSGIASAAVTVFESCFNSHPATRYVEHIVDDDEDPEEAKQRADAVRVKVEAARAKFCNAIYEDFQFVYRNPLDRSDKQGLFHSPFVLPLLATYVEQTAQALDIPELYEPNHLQHPTFPNRPVGVIGLIGAACERVILLWANGRIKFNADGKAFCPKKLNHNTGKMSTASTDFRANNFLSKTHDYKESALILSREQMKALITAAASYMNHSDSKDVQPLAVQQTARRDRLCEGGSAAATRVNQDWSDEQDNSGERKDGQGAAAGSARVKNDAPRKRDAAGKNRAGNKNTITIKTEDGDANEGNDESADENEDQGAGDGEPGKDDDRNEDENANNDNDEDNEDEAEDENEANDVDASNDAEDDEVGNDSDSSTDTSDGELWARTASSSYDHPDEY
ncbi:hypothetical protein C2E23DRAFT_857148 [Lenzites betulinus]|nr:hypothetical protein C2E23DRAFT_857148 [Lenzites betulinus]